MQSDDTTPRGDSDLEESEAEPEPAPAKSGSNAGKARSQEVRSTPAATDRDDPVRSQERKLPSIAVPDEPVDASEPSVEQEKKPVLPEEDLAVEMEIKGPQEDPESPPNRYSGTNGGGRSPLSQETLERIHASSGGYPLVTFSYWIDGSTLHVLANPLEADGDFSAMPRYEWIWGDGTTTIGGAYETHEYDEAIEQVIVTVNRLDEDASITHEGTRWIDLTFYEYKGDPAPLPGNVIALDGYRYLDNSRPMTSDVGEFIESAPMPSLASLLGLLVALALFGRRTLSA